MCINKFKNNVIEECKKLFAKKETEQDVKDIKNQLINIESKLKNI